MLYIARIFTFLIVLFTTGSCNKVGFQAKPDSPATANATGPNQGDGGTGCTDDTCATPTYGWHQSGFGLCSKPCGTGDQAQIVDCRRSTDNVVVADSFCTGSKPIATRTCNVNACTAAYQWNFTDYGSCSVTCGGGTETRTVVCQDQSGNAAPDANCPLAEAGHLDDLQPGVVQRLELRLDGHEQGSARSPAPTPARPSPTPRSV